jgi:hypothetical protein
MGLGIGAGMALEVAGTTLEESHTGGDFKCSRPPIPICASNCAHCVTRCHAMRSEHIREGAQRSECEIAPEKARSRWQATGSISPLESRSDLDPQSRADRRPLPRRSPNLQGPCSPERRTSFARPVLYWSSRARPRNRREPQRRPDLESGCLEGMRCTSGLPLTG